MLPANVFAPLYLASRVKHLMHGSQLAMQCIGGGASLMSNQAGLGCSFSTLGAAQSQTSRVDPIRWVFLGPPGVGKGTYAALTAKHFGVAHIATGDLIRDEIKAATSLGQHMKSLVASGQLVSDDLIFQLLQRRLDAGRALGEAGFILDGFPRTKAQAELLQQVLPIQLALNMSLREEVLVEKCLGRRMCKHCGKNYNIADIHLPASPDGLRPEIRMPPLSPPPECADHLETRSDDKEEVVKARLKVYRDKSIPVEDVFRAAGVLREFEITAGIPETLPRLLATLTPYAALPQSAAAAASVSPSRHTGAEPQRVRAACA